MLRRLSVCVPSVTVARFYTPSEELKKLYASDFERMHFPVNIIPSDSVTFAKFLYKAVEPKNSFDAILKDFQTIAASIPKLPVFWERTVVVSEVKEFKSLSAPTIFTLEWMQSNGMLDLLPDVVEVYETYVNAKMKRVTAKIHVAPGKEQDRALIEKAKKVAEQVVKDSKELAGYTLVLKVMVDRSIVEGFAVDVQGTYVNNAVGRQKETQASGEADYTTIPPPRLTKTTWEDNIETEMLRKYLDSLALYDAEELKNGV
ncbi:putative ATP synthase delta (OSCP) subunit [Leishmania utingensis]|uniref:ATP synthase delta (OSCP) subunit n=1 Tax=Leishmania utingensis TaxID=653362 RepID=A0AAW3B0H0_9TRYP